MDYKKLGIKVDSFFSDLYQFVKAPVQKEVNNIQKEGFVSWATNIINTGYFCCADICERGFFKQAGKKIDVISEQGFMKWAEEKLNREVKAIFSDEDVQIFVAASIKVIGVYALLEIAPQGIGLFASCGYALSQMVKRELGSRIAGKTGPVSINHALILKALREWITFALSGNPTNLPFFSTVAAGVAFEWDTFTFNMGGAIMARKETEELHKDKPELQDKTAS